MSACCLVDDQAGDCSSPVPLRQGDSPCTLSAMTETAYTICFPHVGWETKENAHTTGRPTGAMKMKKKAGQESILSCRFFLIFPGCKSIRTAVFHTAQPVGGSAAANSQSHNVPFAKGFLRVAVAHPIRKNTFVLGKSMCACYFVSPGNCLCETDCYFRKWVQGQ